MTRFGIYGAKGRLAPQKKKKGLLSSSGSFKIRPATRKSWLGRLLDALRGLFDRGHSKSYARGSKTLQKQSKENLQRTDQLNRKVGRVRERK